LKVANIRGESGTLYTAGWCINQQIPCLTHGRQAHAPLRGGSEWLVARVVVVVGAIAETVEKKIQSQRPHPLKGAKDAAAPLEAEALQATRDHV